MAGSLYFPRKENNSSWVIGLEKHLVRKFFPFIHISCSPRALACTGSFQPTDLSVTYTYKIKYSSQTPPRVYVLSPIIPYHKDIHMYPADNSLCLHYPKDYSWNKSYHLYNTIIPWTHEWFLFYEWYLISGVWKHPSVEHRNHKNK